MSDSVEVRKFRAMMRGNQLASTSDDRCNRRPLLTSTGELQMIVLLIVIAVVVVWLVVGAIMNNAYPTGSNVDPHPTTPDPTPTVREECVVCQKLESWWGSLDWLGKSAGAAWYAINHLACTIKGC
jgi:hypothetical protein